MTLFIMLGSLNALLAVALGAFGAHGLKSRVTTDMLAVWQTGVHYQMFHALGLILIGILIQLQPQVGALRLSGYFLLGGILLFSGSLYLMVLSGVRALGAITPIGGLAFIVGWLVLAIGIWRNG